MEHPGNSRYMGFEVLVVPDTRKVTTASLETGQQEARNPEANFRHEEVLLKLAEVDRLTWSTRHHKKFSEVNQASPVYR